MQIVIANSNPIHQLAIQSVVDKYHAVYIDKNEKLTLALLEKIEPTFLFFIHWSYIIPKEIFEKYTCIVFHMTDLPYGRGGSPLQNLIARGHKETKISALRVNDGIDTGPVFLKKPLSLLGTAEEIFLRAGDVVYGMIDEIIEQDLQPKEQQGEATIFKRRKRADGDISSTKDINTIYDYIRMLDAEGYPNAFIETQHFTFEFTRASLKKDGILADVKITYKK